MKIARAFLLVFAPVPLSMGVVAGEQEKNMEEVRVVGLSPLALDLLSDQGPMHVQRFDSEDLEKSSRYSVAQYLDQRAMGITVNDAQNNPLQPDVRFRGYAASPLLGSSQGVVVYFNGVRVNESFGDTVNWDLLPQSTVSEMAIVAGPNPVFGQNALGGAIVMAGKNGFNFGGGRISAGVGSYGARSIVTEYGSKSDGWGVYLNLEGYEEDGWRDFSPTESQNAYVALSRHYDSTHWDLYLHQSQSELKGNGAVPIGLLKQDREAVFTHPDLTENDMSMVNLVMNHWFDSDARLSGNLFFRQIRNDAFNGDGSDKDECEPPNDDFLCEEEEEGGEQAEDQNGNPVSSEFNAINNISQRDQNTWGASLTFYKTALLGEVRNHWTLGVDYLAGTTDFDSSVEFAQLKDNRSTTRSGLYDEEGYTALRSDIDMAAIYFSNTIVPAEDLVLQLSMRFNSVDVAGKDQSGERPELTASHRYSQLNGGIGLAWRVSDQTQLYGGLYQSSRAPTPVELACSHPEAPCNLPNTFLADPPLDDVVSQSVELGLRTQFAQQWHWDIALFHTVNKDDIHFQTTGGVSSNQGFFTNIGDTLHRGVETQLSAEFESLDISLGYTYLDATYEDDYISFSPNNPAADEAQLEVKSGSRIPAIAQHTIKLAADYSWSERIQSGVEVNASSGVYFRGDEANVDDKTDDYAVANGYIRYQLASHWTLSLQVSNLLDEEYERFGLYGEPDEVLEDLENDNPRFLSPAPPRTWMLRVDYRW